MKKTLVNMKFSLAKITNEVIGWTEVVVAIFIFVLVLNGLYRLILVIPLDDYFIKHFHDEFATLLSNILLLVVGLELALLLIKHKIENIIEIMFFVVARKFVIQTHQVYELVIGVVALAGLFAIKKYLMINDKQSGG